MAPSGDVRLRPAAVACLFLLLAFALPSGAAARTLTFEDRVACQEAIERVYNRHQIGAVKA